MCKRSLRVESHNVLDPRLAVALELGAVVVTPNNRLARDLVSRFDEAQRARGLRAWPSASALPWSAWLRSLWLAALTQPAAGAPRALFDSVAALHLWQDIIAASHSDLLDTRGAARQAADAWSLFQAWRLPGESLQAWRRANPLDDAGTFARWAERYQGKLHALNMLDAAQLSDALIGVAGSLERGSIVLHGFIELAPAQRRLIDALLQEGWSITSSTVPPQAVSKRVRMQFTTPQDELQGALSWARQIAVADPRARVGIVLADLDSRRDEAIALSDEILAPECLLEGGTALARPYGVSLGAPLAGQGIVATALTLIEIGSGRVAAAQAAALLRSPYLPDAGARWLARSDVERTWREQGRHDVHFNDIVGTLRKPDAALATRWQAVRPLTRTARSPRDWAQAWTDWLRALGWPGDRVLGSAEWQARDAFSDALLKFVGLHDVAPQLDAGAATEALRAIVAEQVFQPKTPAARIQILGVLEAAGLQFDALWLGGFSSERWPASPAPNPFLPLAWQRERDVPRSHPGRELDYAQRLTGGFASAAGEVVASFARVAREAEQTLSPLFARWPEGRSRDEAPHSRIADIVAKATRSVAWRDDQAPPMPPGTDVRGGSRLVESQSACPFQAFARLRLKAEAWPSPDEGLSPFERGNLLHSAMQVLWDALHDKASLVRLSPDELDVRIDAAIGAAIAKLPAGEMALACAANRRERASAHGRLHARLARVRAAAPGFPGARDRSGQRARPRRPAPDAAHRPHGYVERRQHRDHRLQVGPGAKTCPVVLRSAGRHADRLVRARGTRRNADASGSRRRLRTTQGRRGERGRSRSRRACLARIEDAARCAGRTGSAVGRTAIALGGVARPDRAGLPRRPRPALRRATARRAVDATCSHCAEFANSARKRCPIPGSILKMSESDRSAIDDEARRRALDVEHSWLVPGARRIGQDGLADPALSRAAARVDATRAHRRDDLHAQGRCGDAGPRGRGDRARG